ncbi:putative occludin domain-containing protein [Dioscorea sansibarensis]
MFKLGRGGTGAGGSGRGGGGKRALPPPPPPRPGARPPAARGVGRGGRQGPGGGSGEPPSREESFSLVPGPSLNFAAIIRLTPDIVNEIRRAEAQGGAARVKFDSNPNNHSGNVIDIGGKEFRFTWSRELGDLCDIYEERQSGEDGHGLLVERGAAWRKLNVQRILDESTKNHVKMLSEEAERQSKSRKSIVLDPANPSVKNQAKTMAAAAVEGSMRRMSWKRKKDTFYKKHKGEQNSGPCVVSSKPFPKGGISSNNTTKAMPAVSPQLSPLEQPGPGTSSSPIVASNYTKEDLNIEEIFGPFTGGKEDTGSFGKEMSCNVNDRDVAGKHRDLRSLLISRLSENPKGMNLKENSLEKAVGGMIPNAEKKIESILKNIAIFQAPGRYILKPGVEVENNRKLGSESGSSPESAHDHTGAAESFFTEKGSQENIGQETKLNSKLEEESDPFTVIDMNPSGPDPSSGKEKAGNESEARANSSSESGSDSESDSDSSDSESDSGSQSRSPAGSASASSSNSESDNSSSSKEGSDVDVDIMTSDDEKEEAERKAEAPNAKVSSSPGEWQQNDGLPAQNGNIEGHRDERFTSSPLDLNDFDGGDERDVDIIESPLNNGPKASEILEKEIAKIADLETYPMNSKYSAEVLAFSPDKHKKTERLLAYARNSTDDPNHQTFDRSVTGTQTIFSEKSGPDKMDVKEKNSKARSRKASDREEFQDKSEISKRSKSTSSAKTLYSGKGKDSTNSEDLQNITPEKSRPGQYKDHILQADNNMRLNANAEASMQDYSLSVTGKFKAFGNIGRKQPGPDFQNTPSYEGDQPGQRISDFGGKRKASNNVDKSTRYVENSGRGNKLAETLSVHPDESDASTMKNIPLHENILMARNKLHKDLRDENGDSSERYLTKNMRESIAGDKLSSTPDSYSRKSAELKDSGQVPQFRRSDMVNPPVVDRKGNALRRELSDLELGEFREPLATEENVGVKRLFERKDSFKSSDNKIAIPNNLYQDMNKGRTVTNSTIDSKRQSPSIMRGVSNGKQDGFDRRIEDNLVNSSQPQQRVPVSQGQPLLKDQVDSEAVSHLDKSTEIVGRTEKKTNEGIGLECHAPRNDHKCGGTTGSKTIKESKSQKINSLRDSAGQGNNTAWVESNANDRGRRESSSDEDSFFYTKYDKDEPELKPPIKDYLQYKEYVQEFCEKYGHYCSLNKNLENLRNDFLGLGQELGRAKGRDMEEYYDILEHLREMYRQHGEKHKQMKKVYILLHEELKHLKQRIKDFAEAYSQE